jgi:hypothetical protein
VVDFIDAQFKYHARAFQVIYSEATDQYTGWWHIIDHENPESFADDYGPVMIRKSGNCDQNLVCVEFLSMAPDQGGFKKRCFHDDRNLFGLNSNFLFPLKSRKMDSDLHAYSRPGWNYKRFQELFN